MGNICCSEQQKIEKEYSSKILRPISQTKSTNHKTLYTPSMNFQENISKIKQTEIDVQEDNNQENISQKLSEVTILKIRLHPPANCYTFQQSRNVTRIQLDQPTFYLSRMVVKINLDEPELQWHHTQEQKFIDSPFEFDLDLREEILTLQNQNTRDTSDEKSPFGLSRRSSKLKLPTKIQRRQTLIPQQNKDLKLDQIEQLLDYNDDIYQKGPKTSRNKNFNPRKSIIAHSSTFKFFKENFEGSNPFGIENLEVVDRTSLRSNDQSKKFVAKTPRNTVIKKPQTKDKDMKQKKPPQATKNEVIATRCIKQQGKKSKSYIGDMNRQGQMHGNGFLEMADGTSYKGQFKFNMFNGQGTYQWPDGLKFTGQFQNNHRHGLGQEIHEDKQVISGYWLNNKYMRWK